jgi:hypothetical protein
MPLNPVSVGRSGTQPPSWAAECAAECAADPPAISSSIDRFHVSLGSADQTCHRLFELPTLHHG